jgi:hypothetical protein
MVSIIDYADAVRYNVGSLLQAYPKLNSCADIISSLFSDLLFRPYSLRKPTDATALILGFLAHSSWMSAVMLVGASNVTDGLACIRKTIESTCYATKVIQSEHNEQLWRTHRRDRSKQREFTAVFSIPGKYVDEEYRLLRPLLVAYDMACSLGAHADFGTLAGRLHSNLDMSYFCSDQDLVLRAFIYVQLLGYRSLVALEGIYRSFSTSDGDTTIQRATDAIAAARLEIAEMNGPLTPEEARFIIEDDMGEVDRAFEGIVHRYGQSGPRRR